MLQTISLPHTPVSHSVNHSVTKPLSHQSVTTQSLSQPLYCSKLAHILSVAPACVQQYRCCTAMISSCLPSSSARLARAAAVRATNSVGPWLINNTSSATSRFISAVKSCCTHTVRIRTHTVKVLHTHCQTTVYARSQTTIHGKLLCA